MKKHNQKIVAIIQARMGSSRLPGKVLKTISGKPMLLHTYERVCQSKLVNEIIIATTNDQSDDLIAQFCDHHNLQYFRGNQFDVLDRYFQAARIHLAEIIVRITADCPLMDPALIDQTIISFLEQKVDFAANRLPPPWKRTYPIGLDVEVCSFNALEKAWTESKLVYEREHVMPYLYDQTDRFKTLLIHHETDYGQKRWTVDTPQDLLVVEMIINNFLPSNRFSWLDVIDFVSLHPEIEQMNQEVSAKSVEIIDERFSTWEGNSN